MSDSMFTGLRIACHVVSGVDCWINSLHWYANDSVYNPFTVALQSEDSSLCHFSLQQYSMNYSYFQLVHQISHAMLSGALAIVETIKNPLSCCPGCQSEF